MTYLNIIAGSIIHKCRNSAEMQDNLNYTCKLCGKSFCDNANLRRHSMRKTPCQPILDTVTIGNICRYCGRKFMSQSSMYRHIRQNCKIANSDEGMEKLLDHTLAKQLAVMKQEHHAEAAMQGAKIDELTALIKQMAGQLALLPAAQVINAPGATINNGPVNNIHIHPWDGDQRIGVDLAHIIAAFTDNTKLREYTRMGDHELVDPEIAPPYVTELLMDLTKRAHADPASRNVYLNPRRADQVLVHKRSGSWEVLPLLEATRLLFDGVAQGIQRVSRNCKEATHLPLEAQNALSMAGLLYDDEPDEYARRAKTPMAAHLSLVEKTQNTGPTHAAINHL